MGWSVLTLWIHLGRSDPFFDPYFSTVKKKRVEQKGGMNMGDFHGDLSNGRFAMKSFLDEKRLDGNVFLIYLGWELRNVEDPKAEKTGNSSPIVTKTHRATRMI